MSNFEIFVDGQWKTKEDIEIFDKGRGSFDILMNEISSIENDFNSTSYYDKLRCRLDGKEFNSVLCARKRTNSVTLTCTFLARR